MQSSMLGCTPIAFAQSIWSCPVPMALDSQSLALPPPQRSVAAQTAETYVWQAVMAGAGSAISAKSQPVRSLVAVQDALVNA